MSYTPYTLQPILLSASVEESNKGLHVAPSSSSPAIPSVSPPLSFFGRRTTSPPPLDGQSRGNPPRINTILSSQTINTQLSGSFTIDSVEAWDTDLYLGTSDGHILHFILEAKGKIDQNTSVPYASRLERKINLGFGKKSVERILVLPQVSKAVVLCDSILSFYSLPFFDPIPISLIPHIKGVSCFSHDAAEEVHIGEDGTVELCVVKRRVVQVLKIGELVQLKKELPLPDGAIMITRYSCNLCLADAKFYRMIDLQQSTAISLCSTPRITPTTTASTYLGSPQLVARPVATVVKEDEFLVVSTMLPDQTTIGVLVNGAGDPLHGTIQWSSYPKALCVEIPYIAALLRNNTIEIHNVLDQQRLQVIYLDPSFEARGMSFGHGISVWMENLAIRLKRCPWPSQNSNIDLDSEIDLQNMLGREAARYSTVPARILVYGRDAVMAQLPTPLLLQVDELLDSSHVEEGIVMADHAFNSMSVDNSVYTERLRSEFDYIYQKAGLLLLQATVFDDAFALLSKGRMDPRVVISLFSNLIREEWLYESPRIIVFDTVKTILEQVGTIDDIVTSTIEKNYGIDIDHETASSANMRSALLKNAVDALLRYLLVERVRRHKTRMSGNAIDKAIDTTLLSVYIINEDSKAIFDFLRKPNKCCAEHSVDALISSKRYHALSVLYESKSMFKNVLDVWTKIYTGEYPDTTFTDSLGRIKHLLLQDINTHKLSLSDVMHYTWWLTDQNPTDGVEVFIRSPRTADMDPAIILEKLEKYGNRIVRSYLEYLVLERKSEFAEYHTRLACSYVHDVQEEMKTEMQQEQTHDDLVHLYNQFVKSEDKKPKDLSKAPNQPTFISFLFQQEQTMWIKKRLMLIKLLQRSPFYSAEDLLKVLSDNKQLNIEQVIVYGRMGMHTEALYILIYDLGDFTGAETYCVTSGQSVGTIIDLVQTQSTQLQPTRSSSLAANKHYKSSDTKKEREYTQKMSRMDMMLKKLSKEELEERRTLFSTLLKTYLAIQDSQIMLSRTVHLLNTQGFYLDMSKVLSSISDEWPIEILQDFLTKSLRRSLHVYRQSNIVVGLSRGENVMVGSQLIEIYNDIGPIYVDEQSLCKKCNRYLGDTVFVRNNDRGQLLHIHCAKILGLIDSDENSS